MIKWWMKKTETLRSICKRVNKKKGLSKLPLRRWKRESLWERLREEKEGNLLNEESEGRIEEAMEKENQCVQSDECGKRIESETNWIA